MADTIFQVGGISATGEDGGGGAGGASGVITDPAATITFPTDFGANNGVLNRTSEYTGGVANGKTLIVSFWFRFTTLDFNFRQIYSHQYNAGSNEAVGLTSINGVIILNAAYSGGDTLTLHTNGGISVNTWHHYIASFDVAQASSVDRVYVDGVDRTNVIFHSNNEIPYNSINEYLIGNAFSGGPVPNFQLEGCIADFYLAYNQYVDLTVAANRQKWRSASGKRVNLGSDGSKATGIAPEVYLHNEFSTFHQNLGTGGDFTVVLGSLSACGTAP